VQIKVKLNVYFPKDIGLSPNGAFVYCRWLDENKLMDYDQAGKERKLQLQELEETHWKSMTI